MHLPAVVQRLGTAALCQALKLRFWVVGKLLLHEQRFKRTAILGYIGSQSVDGTLHKGIRRCLIGRRITASTYHVFCLAPTASKAANCAHLWTLTWTVTFCEVSVQGTMSPHTDRAGAATLRSQLLAPPERLDTEAPKAPAVSPTPAATVPAAAAATPLALPPRPASSSPTRFLIKHVRLGFLTGLAQPKVIWYPHSSVPCSGCVRTQKRCR